MYLRCHKLWTSLSCPEQRCWLWGCRTQSSCSLCQTFLCGTCWLVLSFQLYILQPSQGSYRALNWPAPFLSFVVEDHFDHLWEYCSGVNASPAESELIVRNNVAATAPLPVWPVVVTPGRPSAPTKTSPSPCRHLGILQPCGNEQITSPPHQIAITGILWPDSLIYLAALKMNWWDT